MQLCGGKFGSKGWGAVKRLILPLAIDVVVRRSHLDFHICQGLRVLLQQPSLVKNHRLRHPGHVQVGINPSAYLIESRSSGIRVLPKVYRRSIAGCLGEGLAKAARA